VRGVYHPAQDAHALRELAARRVVVEATGAALAADEPPGPIAFDQPGIVAALERVLLEQAGPEDVELIRTQYQPAAGGDPDSVPMAMYTRLVELQPLDENRLRMLAVERSRRIFEYLTLSQGVVAERIRLGEIVTREESPQQAVIAPLGLAAGQ
jgi:hypothetical protein